MPYNGGKFGAKKTKPRKMTDASQPYTTSNTKTYGAKMPEPYGKKKGMKNMSRKGKKSHSY